MVSNDDENKQKGNKKEHKYTQFKPDPYYEAFRDTIPSPSTKITWVNTLHTYMTFHKMKAYSDLLGNDLENSNSPLNIKSIQAKLTQYIMNEKNRGVRSQSIGTKLTALRHFYWINEVDEIKWDRVRSYLGEAIRAVEDKAYTHEQIARILEFCDYRLKTLVLTQASTGMRIGGVIGLKWGDLEPVERYSIYSFKVYRGTSAEYITFCTPECAFAINQYMEYRRRAGEPITKNSPFIREQFAPKNADKPRPAALKTMQDLVRETFMRVGLRDNPKINAGKRYENMLTHGFRKFAKKNMRKAGVDQIMIEYLVGHKGGDLKMGISRLMMTYDPSEDTELLSEYLKAVNNLTINEEFRLKEALTAEQKRRQEEQARNDKMQAQLDEIKRMIRSGVVATPIEEEEEDKE